MVQNNSDYSSAYTAFTGGAMVSTDRCCRIWKNLSCFSYCIFLLHFLLCSFLSKHENIQLKTYPFRKRRSSHTWILQSNPLSFSELETQCPPSEFYTDSKECPGWHSLHLQHWLGQSAVQCYCWGGHDWWVVTETT